MFRLFYVKTSKDKSELVSKIEKGWLFSSDEVLKACYAFLNLFDTLATKYGDVGKALRENDNAKIEVESRIAQIFFHMRKDLRGRGTRLSVEWAEKNVVIFKWGALMVPEEESHSNAIKSDG